MIVSKQCTQIVCTTKGRDKTSYVDLVYMIADVLKKRSRAGVNIEIIHVKAHTDDTSKPAMLNREADIWAKKALHMEEITIRRPSMKLNPATFEQEPTQTSLRENDEEIRKRSYVPWS